MTRLDALWLCEAIHWRETHAGLFEDSEALRIARQQGGSLEQRAQTRALWLAERDGIPQALQHWQQGARLAALLLAMLAILGGAGMALTALGDGQRPVNVFWALGSLLGLNLALLLAWCACGLLAGHGAALGRTWLWLAARLARDPASLPLAPAFWALIQRHQLGRWWLGCISHGLWLLSGLSAMATAVLMLATRRYEFVWETTLLSGSTFVALTHTLGLLPAALGFNVPASDAVLASGEAALATARQPWATWLLGVLFCYGVLPRAVLGGLSLLLWRRGRGQLTGAPLSPTLQERLLPSHERLGVNDPAPASLPQPHAAHAHGGNGACVLVGVELRSRPWPQPLPTGCSDAGLVDDHGSRTRLLEQLTHQPPARLLIACDPRRSPDRGTLALLTQLSHCAGNTYVWLLPEEGTDPLRLAAWAGALEQAGLAHGPAWPAQWWELAHG